MRGDEVRLYYENNTVMPIMMMLILAAFFIGISIFLYYETIVVEDFGLTSTEGIILIVSMVLTLGITAAVAVIRIKTSVTYKELRVGIFKGRLVPMTDIDSVAVEEFRPMKDYLGWGIRIGRKGLGYIAAGTDKGLRINLKTGKSFLISTKRPFEFESAVNMALRSVKE